MSRADKLIVIGFDSISLPVLEEFVRRGCMPTVSRLIAEGCITQTWPCFPMETGTNWACLATGASPWVHGCNMSLHLAGDPLDRWQRGFPAGLCNAEQLWTAAQRGGKRPVVFDWTQSWPLAFEEGIIHLGEDGRPDNAIGALQEVRAYTTHPRQPGPHVTKIEPRPAGGAAPEGALAFDVPIVPGAASTYAGATIAPLYALVLKGTGGYDRVALYVSRDAAEPLFTVGLNQWSDWKIHTFTVNGRAVRGGLRGRLLTLEPDGSAVHFYLSEIFDQDAFAHPRELVEELLEACGPFVTQCSRQQVVQGGASDIPTYFDEQHHLARWWREAASHILGTKPWDLFMLKWHGPDWTNHLTMYMIDPRHPMYEAEREAEGWRLWEQLMGWGDQIVAAAMKAAGPGALVALVSDHGGGTELPGLRGRRDPNSLLQERGWLVLSPEGKTDWSKSAAYGREHYVFINLRGRDPLGIVEPGAEFETLRDRIIESLLDWKDAAGRHCYRVVLPMETAGRLGVGGERVGDIFMVPSPNPPGAAVDREAFWRTHEVAETGTWDWPRLNTGIHLDDSYFVLHGPGVKRGYRRGRPTLITSVAPTLATAWGIPVPKNADGSVLWDFLE